ncbi:MAG TPA: hypothetical protein VMP89_14385, partial [Solirubrobacteraceae bacterium]|nr:hypothetical protein [Solirubrobacteraceae bacterium]
MFESEGSAADNPHGMESPGATELTWVRPSRAAVLAIQLAGIGAAVVIIVLTWGWDRWDLGRLIAIAVLAAAGDLMAVESDAGSKVRVSGMFIGVTLAAVLLGPGPAALLGVFSIAIGWFSSRESASKLLANALIY